MKTQKICCFTGHRRIADGHIIRLPQLIDEELERLIGEGFTVFRAGGALGFDTLAALKVLEKKKKYDISLELCLPCLDQTLGWSEREKQIFKYIFERADAVRYAEKHYTTGCMYKRNRMLVDGADLCLAFLSSSRGGTAYTCSYALSRGVELINLFDRIEKD